MMKMTAISNTCNKMRDEWDSNLSPHFCYQGRHVVSISVENGATYDPPKPQTGEAKETMYVKILYKQIWNANISI